MQQFLLLLIIILTISVLIIVFGQQIWETIVFIYQLVTFMILGN